MNYRATKYRQGGQWMVSAYDYRVSSFRECGPMSYWQACRAVREANEFEKERRQHIKESRA